jgi:hypothetical protein
MSESDRGGGAPAGRRIAGHAQEDHRTDPYREAKQPEDGTHCPDCGVAWHQGRWQWGVGATDGPSEPCPACRRIRDDFPAGIVELTGGFVAPHADEILALARHQEELEKGEHPLNRIMAVDELPAGLAIRTTDIHLPRRIGEAVHRAYQGDLDVAYDKDGYFVRVHWRRTD